MIGNYFLIWLPLKYLESKHKSAGERELNLTLYIDKQNFASHEINYLRTKEHNYHKRDTVFCQ